MFAASRLARVGGSALALGAGVAVFRAKPNNSDLSVNGGRPSDTDELRRVLGDTETYTQLRAKRDDVQHNFVLRDAGVPGRLERFDVYLADDKSELVIVTRFGDEMTGHAGITHGGAIASVFDQALGIHFFKAAGIGFTANLQVQYKKPVAAGATVVFRTRVDHRERRKVFLSGRAEDEEGTVLAEASSLFILADVSSALSMASKRVKKAIAPSSSAAAATPESRSEPAE